MGLKEAIGPPPRARKAFLSKIRSSTGLDLVVPNNDTFDAEMKVFPDKNVCLSESGV